MLWTLIWSATWKFKKSDHEKLFAQTPNFHHILWISLIERVYIDLTNGSDKNLYYIQYAYANKITRTFR